MKTLQNSKATVDNLTLSKYSVFDTECWERYVW